MKQSIKTESPSHNNNVSNINSLSNENNNKSIINNPCIDGMITGEQQMKYENERLKQALAQR